MNWKGNYVAMFIVMVLAIFNIILYTTLDIASFSIMNSKTNVKMIDSKEKNVKIPFASFIVILILSTIMFILGVYTKNNIIMLLILSFIIILLSIVSIIYFSKDNYNIVDLNIGNIINVKSNETSIILIKISTYTFFCVAIMASIISCV